MNVAVIGLGKQGLSAVEYWLGQGHSVTVCDKNPDTVALENTKSKLGETYLEDLDQFDLIIRSPSIHPGDITSANPDIDIQSKVTTNTNEFFEVCPTKNIIGVTGTKGKGTTSTLITRMLETAGRTVHLGGNIGTPPLEMLKSNIQADDWVVLELANFQLIDIRHSPHIAVCLMVVPEHMNWHHDFTEYIEAKQQLFKWQTSSDTAIYFADNEVSKSIANISAGTKVPYFTSPGAFVDGNKIKIQDRVVCSTNVITLLGAHNWQNICAAVTAVWQITQDIDAIRSAITSFSGLEHRLEFVQEVNGVKYYNDSFGTTPETAIVALASFTEPVVAILGGSDKESDFTELAQKVVAGNVKHIVAIGDTAPKILQVIDTMGGQNIQRTLLEGKTSMTGIVRAATDQAVPGDVVLLSTGSASFGLFENYEDRGTQFKQAVKTLAQL